MAEENSSCVMALQNHKQKYIHVCTCIRERTGQEDIKDIIRKRILRWLDQVWHMDNDKRAKKE